MKVVSYQASQFWNGLPPSERARTLALDRFPDLPVTENAGAYKADKQNTEYRRSSIDAVKTGKVLRDGTAAWLGFLNNQLKLKPSQLIFGQLQSRLMVNMSGGVLENGGMCLDRRTGLPYIPGSSIKGTVRRMAIQELLDTRIEGKSTADLAHLVILIARIFGAGGADWEKGRRKTNGTPGGEFKSDFEFACGQQWEAVREIASSMLLKEPGMPLDPGAEPWKRLSGYAGSTSFLPAYPMDLSGLKLSIPVPQLGSVEMEVLTCHHQKYYSGIKNIALDDEPPIPVVFPAVAAGHIFVFPFTVSGTPAQSQMTDQVRRWIIAALETFGIGAKTAAGYGWFDCSDALQKSVVEQLHARAEQAKRDQEARAAEELRKQGELLKQKAREEEARATAGMTEQERVHFNLSRLTEDQFRAKLEKWKDVNELERNAIYDLFRSVKSALWLDISKKAREGKRKEKERWGMLTNEIFRMANERKEKMPK
jgi:CRISPR/Cas system CMR subunit Cmr6 (Cas7 group RAMP superfamily)